MIAAGFVVLSLLAQAGRAADKPAAEPPQCPFSNTDQIVQTYGRFWGDVSAERGIGREESLRISADLHKVYLCKAKQGGMAAACNGLGTIKTSSGTLVAEQCRTEATGMKGDPHGTPEEIALAQRKAEERKAGEESEAVRRRRQFAFMSYMLGRGEPSACRDAYGALSGGKALPFTEAVFCDKVLAAGKSGGFAGLCSALVRAGWTETACRGSFPARASDCALDEKHQTACEERLQVYDALRAGKPRSCPPDWADLCRPVPAVDCAALAQKTVKNVCAYYRDAWIRTGGAIGQSDADIKKTQELNQQIRGSKSGQQE